MIRMAADLIRRGWDRGVHGVESLLPGARQRREAEEARIQALKDRRIADLRWLMSEPSGRRFVAKLMATAKLQDKTSTEREAGARDLAVELAAELIRIDHKAWLTMLDEAWVDAVNANTAS